MAPGLGNGPWKWLLSYAYSTLYRLEFFMWKLGCWDIHPRGCTLIKDSSSGHFSTASCGHWPPFHPGACSSTTALLLGLTVTPNNTPQHGLSHDSWPARPPETPPLLSASRSEWSQTMEGSRLPPSKWRLCPWAFEGRIFLSWRCQNIMSGMANFLCHLKEVQQPISFLWSKLEDNYSLRDDMYIFKFESSLLNGPLLWVQANIWSCCSNGHRQDHNIALSPSSLSHLCSHFLRDVVHFSHKTN